MNLKRFRKITEYDREKTKKMNNFNFLNENYCKKEQTVIVGDSITELFNMEFFDKYTADTGELVYNRGISGDTCDRLLERFESNVLSLKPSKIVILIGTNDLTIKADPEYIAENIKKMINLTNSICPQTKIYVQAVYPVEAKQKSKNKKIIELNMMIRDMCKENVVYVDTYTPLLDDKGGFNEKYTYDGLHPNAQGFEVVAMELFKYFA